MSRPTDDELLDLRNETYAKADAGWMDWRTAQGRMDDIDQELRDRAEGH